ncbi:MAG: DsrE family protein [Thaumarchaeota archaeon]|nr:DsrE family protein [Nitrososphaerota archaeon]MDE1832141.1 DsrE family protein [Nitrososphaerota archaeon]MDE1841600.1 DsrE family protein [Nitrososphaerota archaeon]
MPQKFAIVTLTDPSDHARIYHAFLYLFDLRDNGLEADLFLDGAGVKIIDTLEKNPSDIIKPLYDRAVRDGLIKEACGFCANAFAVKDKIVKSNINLSPENEHVSIGKLVKEGYAVITV